jgi:hypothetical protein
MGEVDQWARNLGFSFVGLARHDDCDGSTAHFSNYDDPATAARVNGYAICLSSPKTGPTWYLIKGNVAQDEGLLRTRAHLTRSYGLGINDIYKSAEHQDGLSFGYTSSGYRSQENESDVTFDENSTPTKEIVKDQLYTHSGGDSLYYHCGYARHDENGELNESANYGIELGITDRSGEHPEGGAESIRTQAPNGRYFETTRSVGTGYQEGSTSTRNELHLYAPAPSTLASFVKERASDKGCWSH